MASRPERKSSRRSSILKLPKSRNPLQSVEPAPGTPPSGGSSPTRLKRRVSFAEKKHVKEFCDSMVQGTVWDETYEETEISQTRNSTEDNSTVAISESTNITQSMAAEYSREIFNLPSENSQRTENFTPALNLVFFGPGQAEKAIDKENIPINPMADLPRSEDSLVDVDSMPEKYPVASAKFQIYCDNENDIADKDKENIYVGEELGRTLTLPESVCPDDDTYSDGMELTEAIPSFANVNEENVGVQQIIERDLIKVKRDERNKFLDHAMEVSQEIPSVLNNSLREPPRNNFFNVVSGTGHCEYQLSGKTEVFDGKEMELTEAIPSVVNSKRNSIMIPEVRKLTGVIQSKSLQSDIPERTQVFHQGGMEMTEAIPSVLPQRVIADRTALFNQSGMKMTEVVPSVMNFKGQTRKSIIDPRDMELTEAIPSMPSHSEIPERTQVFHQRGMEMTEAIPSVLSQRAIPDRTTMFNQSGMEMTQAISSISSQPQIRERTQVFHQRGMEMTEAIPSVLSQRAIPDRTKMFHQSEMEMTEAISSVNNSKRHPRKSIMNPGDMELTEAIPSMASHPEVLEKTRVFHQAGMEMTEAIPSLLLQRAIPDKTTIFNRSGMEMTEAIPSVINSNRHPRKSIMNPGDMELTEAISSMSTHSTISERTQLFHQRGMELTEAIPSVINPNRHARKSVMDLGDMELTEAIPSMPSQPEIPERTQVFHQRGMEMTEAIPSVLTQRGIPNKTTMSNQSGMEMTEAISSVINSKRQPRRSVRNPQDMELTEAIPSMSSHPERTQVFNQNGMEMTEAIPSVINSNRHARRSVVNSGDMELTDARTQVFHQNGMEMTEAIHSVLPRRNTFNETTQRIEMHNYFPELTESIPAVKRPYKSIASQSNDLSLSSPCAKLSKDQLPFNPVSTPEAKQRLHRILHSQTDSPSPFFQNPTTEVATAISSRLKPQRKLPIPETAHNESMEITEVIQSSSSIHCPPEFDLPTIKQNGRESAPILSSNYPLENVEVESSNSLKENKPPENERQRKSSIVRPLFEKDDEITDPTAVPLEDSNASIEALRLRPSLDGRDEGEFTCELTGKVVRDHEKSNIIEEEPPSFLFENISQENSCSDSPYDYENRENGDECQNGSEGEQNGSKTLENGREPQNIDEGRQDNNESQNNVEGEQNGAEDQDGGCEFQQPPKPPTYQKIQVGNDEMTIDIGRVALPEVDFTEEITTSHRRPPSSMPQSGAESNEEAMIKRRRTYNVPADSSILLQMKDLQDVSVNPRMTHIIHRHEEEKNEVIRERNLSKSCVINKQTLTQSVEVDGQVRVERVDTSTMVTYDPDSKRENPDSSDANYIAPDENEEIVTLEKRKRVRSDNYLINILDNKVNVEFDVQEKEVRSMARPTVTNRKIPEEDRSVLKNHHKISKNEKSRLKSIHEDPVVVENELVIKRIEKLRKQEELYQLQLLKKQEKQLSPQVSTSPLVAPRRSIDPTELSVFAMMKRQLESQAESPECLWKILKLTEERIFIEYKKNAFTFGCKFHVPDSPDELERIEKIILIPRVNPEEPSFVRIIDKLIMQKLNAEELKKKYKTYDNVAAMIQRITEDIYVIYDFYDELEKMSYCNRMGMDGDRIWFWVGTRSINTLVKIFMRIKPFDRIGTEDIEVVQIFGNVRTADVKNLIRNVKRNCKFLTMYKNDVADYLELMEEASSKT